MLKQRSTTSLNAGYGSTTSYGVEGRSSSSPTDVHTHGGTSKIHHEDVPNSCRILQDTSHPSALNRVIHFIFRPFKLKLIIFFSQPELPVTRFHSFFTSGEELSTRLGHRMVTVNPHADIDVFTEGKRHAVRDGLRNVSIKFSPVLLRKYG